MTFRMDIETAYLERRPAPDLDWFMVAAATKRLYSVLVSLRYGPEVLGMRSDAGETMRAEKDALLAVHDVITAHTGLSVPEMAEA